MKDALSAIKEWITNISDVLLAFVIFFVLIGMLVSVLFSGGPFVAGVLALAGSAGFTNLMFLLVLVYFFNTFKRG